MKKFFTAVTIGISYLGLALMFCRFTQKYTGLAVTSIGLWVVYLAIFICPSIGICLTIKYHRQK